MRGRVKLQVELAMSYLTLAVVNFWDRKKCGISASSVLGCTTIQVSRRRAALGPKSCIFISSFKCAYIRSAVAPVGPANVVELER